MKNIEVNIIASFKAFMSILAVLLCISCAKSTNFDDEYVSFTIPDGVEIESVDGTLFKGYNLDKEGEYRLSISEIPIGIVPGKSRFLARVMGCRWIEDMEPERDEIDGYPVTVYRGVMKDNYDIYSNTYIFSNGDKSVVLLESFKNDSTSWWKENLKWKMPKRTELSLEKRTDKFEKFLNSLMAQEIGANVKITADNNNVCLKITVPDDYDYKMPNDKKMQRDTWQLINYFDVFAEYAAQKSDFFINVEDQSGNDLGGFYFPYFLYSQIEDEPQLTFDEEYEIIEQND